MSIPTDRKYTKSHEWVRIDGEEVVVGITDFAQKEMGDIVYIDLPKVGQKLEKGSESGVIESVKAASDIYAPISGEVSRVNELVQADASLINRDPYGEGWFYAIKLEDPAQLDGLLESAQYAQLIENEE